MKITKYTVTLATSVALMLALKATATDNAAGSPYLGVLTTATSAELPAKAADLVVQADVKNLKQTTIDVVKAAVGLNPAAAPAIVGSIAQGSPSMAGTAAVTAASLVPNQVVAIARAAAAAAPSKAGAIVEAICRALPATYQVVAGAVADVVPGAGKEILAAIGTAIPELKNTISQALASFGGNIPSVSMVLAQVAQTESSSGTAAVSSGATPTLARGPGATTPQVPLSGTPPVINPSSGSPAPPGGLNYTPP
jgi:hypothetical protein